MQTSAARLGILGMALIGLTAMWAPASVAADTDYPTKPVKIVVASAAGGILDTVARQVALGLSVNTGQQFIVENKPGAGGIIGTEIVAKAAPDGYTAGHIATSHAINPSVYAKLPYDTMTDLAPVTQTVNLTNLLVVKPDLPANNLRELIALAKAQPGKLTFGSAGVGQSNHLSGEMLKQMANIDIVHVPYKGSGPALADAVGGQVEILFDNLPSSMPMIQAGKLRALAIAWPQRIDSIKDVPTLAQAGYPQLNQPVWYGLLAPAGTPPEIVNKLRDAAVVALKDPTVVRVLDEQGSTASGNTPAEFAAEIKAQFDWARDVVTKQKIEMK